MKTEITAKLIAEHDRAECLARRARHRKKTATATKCEGYRDGLAFAIKLSDHDPATGIPPATPMRTIMENKKLIAERHGSELAAAAVIGLIRAWINRAAIDGVAATEVWLGPKEARIIATEMTWNALEGRMDYTHANALALVLDDLEGAQISGLTVRLMAKDGVRVGVGWPNSAAPQTPNT